jgi:hypothetical protein
MLAGIGEPADGDIPTVGGSNHWAVTAPDILVRLTVLMCLVGRYITAVVPSDVSAAVT